MKFGLKDREIRLINSIFASFLPVKRVFIYGSRAKGTFRGVSDIDLMVEPEKGKKISEALIKSALEDLPLIYSIDLMSEEEMTDGDFREEYEKTKQIFYEKKGSSRKAGK